MRTIFNRPTLIIPDVYIHIYITFMMLIINNIEGYPSRIAVLGVKSMERSARRAGWTLAVA